MLPGTSILIVDGLRPNLEYASVVWDPHLGTLLLLKVFKQKFTLWVCSKQWNSSYDAILNAPAVPTLSSRKKTQSFVHCSIFLLVPSLLPIVVYFLFQLTSKKVYNCRTNSSQHSFFLHIHQSYME